MKCRRWVVIKHNRHNLHQLNKKLRFKFLKIYLQYKDDRKSPQVEIVTNVNEKRTSGNVAGVTSAKNNTTRDFRTSQDSGISVVS